MDEHAESAERPSIVAACSVAAASNRRLRIAAVLNRFSCYCLILSVGVLWFYMYVAQWKLMYLRGNPIYEYVADCLAIIGLLLGIISFRFGKVWGLLFGVINLLFAIFFPSLGFA